MSKIEIIHGSCVNQEVDAIVNAANKYLLAGSGICGAIFKTAGYTELTNACNNINTPLNDGDAVITPAFNITTTKCIIHAVGPDFRQTPNSFDKLFNAYYNSLLVLKDNNLQSISFPLISAGIFGYGLKNPAKISAEQCIKAYNKFIVDYPDYDIYVKLCAYSDNEYEEIKRSI